jgi:predicted metalloprotease with PDZ domain
MSNLLRVFLATICFTWLSFPASAQERPWLGICVKGRPGSFHSVQVSMNNDEVASGVQIASVAGPAAAAGVQVTDVLAEIDGLPGIEFNRSMCNLASKRIGDTVTVVVIRAGEPLRFTAILQPWPQDRRMPALTCADGRMVTTAAPHLQSIPAASADLSSLPALAVGLHPQTSGCLRRASQDH